MNLDQIQYLFEINGIIFIYNRKTQDKFRTLEL